MAKTPKIYTRLTRDAAGLGSYYSLWLGPDHLMLVTSSGYSESYARVQLRDVKAFFLTPTGRRLWFGLGWGAIVVLSVIAILVNLATKSVPVISVFFLVFGLIGLIWNHVLGAGCRAYAVTGVQTARLPSLVRLKKAHRVIAQLQPAIATAQADLVPPPPAAESALPAAPAVEPVLEAPPPETPPTAP